MRVSEWYSQVAQNYLLGCHGMRGELQAFEYLNV